VTNRKRTRVLAQRKADRRAARQHRQHQQRLVALAVIGVVAVAGIAAFLLLRPSDDIAALCAEPGPVSTQTQSWPTAPGADTRVQRVTFDTNCGAIVIETQANDAPETVGSIAFLAEQGFYDGTSCHRLTTEGLFILQCGDPQGDGRGNPGYTVPDENLPPETAQNYPAGTVAMANAGPGTSGSQFFIAYQDTTLPPAYSVWGTVVEGLDIVTTLAARGTRDGSPDGPPLQQIVIESASVARG
jgi:peptidyl-prolyl cis-trans isomerase B (cyclophilin B)